MGHVEEPKLERKEGQTYPGVLVDTKVRAWAIKGCVISMQEQEQKALRFV